MFSHLKEKGLGDVTQSAADCDMFNNDPADLNGDYADVEDPQPGASLWLIKTADSSLGDNTACQIYTKINK
jgi:hypothetical protein